MNERYLIFIERGGRYGDNAAYMRFIDNRRRAYLVARNIPHIFDQPDFTRFMGEGR